MDVLISIDGSFQLLLYLYAYQLVPLLGTANAKHGSDDPAGHAAKNLDAPDVLTI
jgi:hypothetical protein